LTSHFFIDARWFCGLFLGDFFSFFSVSMSSNQSTGLKSSLKSSISYKQSSEIVAEALKEARRTRLAPIAICVLDAGGNLVAFGREDGCSLLREAVARGKVQKKNWKCFVDTFFWQASGALGFGMSSRAIAENATVRPAFWHSVFGIGPVIASPGGVLIVGKKGKIVGAVGVSGDVGDEDESVAIHAIR
jgi:uncharacterized protein GlcG (DUF336 family)